MSPLQLGMSLRTQTDRLGLVGRALETAGRTLAEAPACHPSSDPQGRMALSLGGEPLPPLQLSVHTAIFSMSARNNSQL